MLVQWFGFRLKDYYSAQPVLNYFGKLDDADLGPQRETHEAALPDMPAGTYIVEYGTENGAQDVQIVLLSRHGVNGDNEAPVVLLRQSLVPGEALRFALEKDARECVVRLSATTAGWEPGTLAVASTVPVVNDSAFICLCILAAGVALVLLRRRTLVRPIQLIGADGTPQKALAYGICVLAALVATLPMLRDFILVYLDTGIHLNRIEGLREGMLAGQFPVRINPLMNNGFGYAIPTMYPDLFLYIPALLRLGGVSLLCSWQFFTLVLNLATALLCCHCVSRLCRSFSVGAVAGVLYTLSLYRMYNYCTRGGVGEVLAMAFFPCVALGMYLLVQGEKGAAKWLVIGFTGLVNSHILSTQMALLFCAAVALWNLPKFFGKKALTGLLAAGITLVLNAWVWVPLLSFYRLDLRVLGEEHIQKTAAEMPGFAANFAQMFINEIGNMDEHLVFTVGALLGLGALLYLFARFVLKSDDLQENTARKVGKAALWAAALYMFASSTWFPWKWVLQFAPTKSLLSAQQFPPRFLSAATLALCVLTALAVGAVGKKRMAAALFATLVAAVLCLAPYLDNHIFYRQEEYGGRMTVDRMYFGSPYISDKLYLYETSDAEYLANRGQQLEVSGALAGVSGVEKNGTTLRFDFENQAEEGAFVELPLYYYPGYQAKLAGGERLEMVRDEWDMAAVRLPDGVQEGSVVVRYAEPWYFRVAEAGSALAGLALAGWWFVKKRNGRKAAPAN